MNVELTVMIAFNFDPIDISIAIQIGHWIFDKFVGKS